MIPTTGPKLSSTITPHRMVDAGRAPAASDTACRAASAGKRARSISALRALGERLGGVVAHDIGEARRRHRAKRRLCVERIAEA